MKKVKKQLAHLFDATQCINCGACTTACAQTNYPDLINEFIRPGTRCATTSVRSRSRRTVRCSSRPVPAVLEAPCVTTCPFGANYYDENGLVRNDPKRCIGSPTTAWPPVRTTPAGPTRRRACRASAWARAVWSFHQGGSLPACVTACPAGARLFGDTLDPQSEISRKIASSKTQTLA